MVEKFVVRRCEPYINGGLRCAPRREYRVRHVRFHGASDLKNPKGGKREAPKRRGIRESPSPLSFVVLGSWGSLDLCKGPGSTALRHYELKDILEFENSRGVDGGDERNRSLRGQSFLLFLALCLYTKLNNFFPLMAMSKGTSNLSLSSPASILVP